MQPMKQTPISRCPVKSRSFRRGFLLPFLMISAVALPSFLPAAPGPQNSPKGKGETAKLTLEEKEIIENRELLENLMLLQDLDAIDFLDILNEMEPNWSEGMDSNGDKDSAESAGK